MSGWGSYVRRLPEAGGMRRLPARLVAFIPFAGILLSMAIGFFYPLTGIAFASLLPLERSERLVRLARRISAE